MSFHENQRLVYDGALATVRYHGPLTNTKGDWLGIEWDKVSRGKHNGIHQGQQIFQCRSSAYTAASFIRPARKPDPTRTIVEAIKFKYGGQPFQNGDHSSTVTDLIEISGKTVEKVGFEKVQQQISVLTELRIVLVDDLSVSGIVRFGEDREKVSSAQNELALICPSITELDLGWNPIETWQDIADICAPLKKLRTLKASGLRLRLLDAEVTPKKQSPFDGIEELHLNECLLRPDEIISILSSSESLLFPSLKSLWISQNELRHFRPSSTKDKFPTVTSLVLENNSFTSLEFMVDLLSIFPNARSIALQGNFISSIGGGFAREEEAVATSFPTVETLNLAGNKISSFSFVDALPNLFPNLVSLRLSKNPLYDEQPDFIDTAIHKASDSTYYLTLARIPKLTSLNYTAITTRDREEGEIYYLSVAEKEFKTLLSLNSPNQALGELEFNAVKRKYRLYETLCTKYERDSIFAPTNVNRPGSSDNQLHLSQHPNYQAGTLGARLVTVTFYLPPLNARPSQPPQTPPASPSAKRLSKAQEMPQARRTFTRPLPTTISVYTVKALLSRHFDLPPLQFRLIYESPELDPVREREEMNSKKQRNRAKTKSTTSSPSGKPATSAEFTQTDKWDSWGDWDVDIPSPPTSSPASQSTSTSTTTMTTAAGATDSNSLEDTGDRLLVTERWVDGYLLKDGKWWRRREVEVLDGMASWGDYLENGAREATVRIEPFPPSSSSSSGPAAALSPGHTRV